MQPRTLIAAAAVALSFAAPVGAVTTVYSVQLSGAAESPPNASPGTGVATVTFGAVLNGMDLDVSFSGLEGTVTAAHIHCCTALPGTGTAGVATVTPTFTGFPSGVTAGTYSHSFDMMSASSYNATFITAHTDVPTAFAFLLAGIEAGKAYLNIHTSAFPGGEIRGFLQPVPEPESAALMLAGLALTGWWAKRRRG